MGSEGDGSEVLKKPVVGYNYKTNTSFYLNCINHGSRYGIDPRSIQRALKGEYNIVKGYFWFYVNEFNMDNLNKKLDRELTKRKRKNGTSKYKGVSLCRQTQKWYACIMVNQKTINLGVYSTEIEASAAYIIKFKGVFYR